MLAWGMCCRFTLSPRMLWLKCADCGHIPPLAALGSGILFSYPEVSTVAGVQGLAVYTLSSSLPLLIFGFLGPIIRRKCPDGFVLTECTLASLIFRSRTFFKPSLTGVFLHG